MISALEVELVRINEDGKKEMTGELLKVQIKSSFGSGYLKKRADGSFSFSAKKPDLEYWSKYALGVLLIIYDDETENLYVKKIRQEDYLGAKKKSYPIQFGKENLIEKGKNDFVQKFSTDFTSRVSFDTSEQLTTNLVYIKQHPRRLYMYESKYSTKKEIFEHLGDQNEAPFFLLYNKKIITGNHIAKKFKLFCDCTVADPSKPTIVELEEVLKSQAYRRHLTELMNLMFKNYAGTKAVWYNKDYKRYYFAKPKDAEQRTIKKKSVKTGKATYKKVVTYHEYAADHFYKHVAFEIDYIFNMGHIFMVINPKYLFTTDGKTTLKPAKITKYTNFLTSREWNNQVQDQLYLVLDFLTGEEGTVEVLNTDDLKFFLSRFIHQDVRFGIPSDIPSDRTTIKKQREAQEDAERSKQTSFL